MQSIDAALLEQVAQGGTPAIVGAAAREISRQFPCAGIDSPLRAAHFLAQASYETRNFTRLCENLDYSARRIAQVWPRLAARAAALAGNAEALANAAYANRDGNRDEASGDGWRFRGRGLFMLTGRANYAAFGYVENLDCLAEPDGAVESAVAFWTARDINSAADEDDIERVTRLVSGGSEGVAARTILKLRALRLLQSPQDRQGGASGCQVRASPRA
ncbi:MAG TPA: hypothetical protein VGL35_12075 [Rhizomicrobium sp.]